MNKTLLFSFVLIHSLQIWGQDAILLTDSSGRNDIVSVRINDLLGKAQKTQDSDSLIFYVDKAVLISGKNLKLTAYVHQKAGEIYNDRNLYDKAIENYFQSLRASESLRDSVMIAEVCGTIGSIYLINENLDDALHFWSRAQEIHLSKNNQKGILSSSLSMGAAYQKKRDFTRALHMFKQALLRADSPEHVQEKAILLGNIGSSYMILGRHDSSLTYLEQSLQIKKDHSPEGSIIHTLNDLSELMLLMNKPEESKKYGEEARRRAQAAANANQLRWAHLNLSKSAEATGDYKGAYAHFLKYYQINDSLFGLEKENLIKELQVKYETDKKDQAITTLQREKQIDNLRKTIYLGSGILVLILGAALYNWQRLRAVKNRKLLEKEQELERMKASFFANISHEFRTPLTLIMSPIETMLERAPTKEDRHHLKIMQKSGKRLLKLINEILDLSKIEAGHLDLNYRNVELIDYLNDITLSFSALCKSKNIDLSFSANRKEFNLGCDTAKMNTVLVNIISNAVKNTGEGGRINVEVAARVDEKELEIKVSDTGKGIARDKLPFIFDRYYQAESGESTSDTPGSGIGLSLAKQLVELQNGRIEVNSKLNEGTTFTIVFSLRAEQILEAIPESDSAQDQEGFNIQNASFEPRLPDIESNEVTHKDLPVILLIEDNPDVRYYLKSILINAHTILEAENGKQGVEAAQLHMPDLIISDVMMPEMDGYEACRLLKKDERTSHIPVILLTAKASVDSRITGLETEADMYLSKPFVPRELLAGIRNLIESRKRLRERYNREIQLKPSDISINSVDEQFLNRLMTVLETHYSNADFTVEQLGKEVGMSRSQIHRKLQALTNESSSRFIRSFRLQRAMDMITQRAGTISEISYQVGFNSPSYFNKCFLEHYGFTPSTVLEN